MKKILIIFFLTRISSFSFSQNWQSVGNGVVGNGVRDIFPDTINNLLYVAGLFQYADTTLVNSIASWNGTIWSDLDRAGCICCNPVVSIARYKNEIYATGQDNMSCTTTQSIARWNGNNWSDVDGGIQSGGVLKVLNNELYLMGAFDTVGSNIPANGIAKWDGTQWSDVNNFPNYNIGNNPNYMADVAIYKGELFVAGNFNHQSAIKEIAKWNGMAWDSVGGGIKGGGSTSLRKMEVYNDELYVGGWFHKADGNTGNFLMKWNGSQWADIPDNIIYIGQIWDMKVYNNKLYIVGQFQFAGDTTLFFYNFASFDGSNWCGLGIKKDPSKNDFATEIEFFNNEIYVSGTDIMDGDTVHYIAKWSGGNFMDTCISVVGQSEISNLKSEISISPNPFTDKITVTSNNSITSIVIYNIFGEKIYSPQTLNSKFLILNLDFPKGIYFLTATINNQPQSFKIIKM